jgi:aldose 1-epimerase
MATAPSVRAVDVGPTADGAPAPAFELDSGCGLVVTVCALGATVLAVRLGGCPINVAPCHARAALLDTADLGANPKMGATCGRVANRTARSLFTLDGETHQLTANDGAHHLHGGSLGWDRRVWAVEATAAGAGGAWVRLALESPDGEEGWPGAVAARATLSVAGATLGIEYRAAVRGARATAVNLTNHCYWNLEGLASGSVLGHALALRADEHVPLGAEGLPVGPRCAVAGALDFRGAPRVGEQVAQLAAEQGDGSSPAGSACGFNSAFRVRGWEAPPAATPAAGAGEAHAPALVARLREAALLTAPNGRTSLTLRTTQPSVHLYTGWAFDGAHVCEGAPLLPSSVLALECQAPPDAANTAFGSVPRCVLRPGEEYAHLTTHEFSW